MHGPLHRTFGRGALRAPDVLFGLHCRQSRQALFGHHGVPLFPAFVQFRLLRWLCQLRLRRLPGLCPGLCFMCDEGVQRLLHQVTQARVQPGALFAFQGNVAQSEDLIGEDVKGMPHALTGKYWTYE